MRMLRHTVLVAAAMTVTACHADREALPPAVTPSHSTPAPATTAPPVAPTMPPTASKHTTEGAKAFVHYYVAAINYAESTLDTQPVESASLPTCTGCAGGIESIQNISDSGGSISGGEISVTSIEAGPIDKAGVVSLWFIEKDSPEKVSIPNTNTIIHRGGTHKMSMTLLAQPDGWKTSDYRAQP